MVGKWFRAPVCAALGLAGVWLTASAWAAPVDDKKDNLPDISTIMKKAHKGSDAYMAKIKSSAEGGKWDDAQKFAKDHAIVAEALGKNKPPKGTPESWDKLTRKYAANAKAVLDATEKKDADATKAAVGVIAKSCGECHGAHKPK